MARAGDYLAMSRPISMRVVWSATALAQDQPRPASIREVTLSDLCEAARIPCRITSDQPKRIVIHAGRDHLRDPRTYFVGMPGTRAKGALTRVRALRVLEVLAYGFLDYGARETVCGRGLFVAARPKRRPRTVEWQRRRAATRYADRRLA
jgi:hypothetical protein